MRARRATVLAVVFAWSTLGRQAASAPRALTTGDDLLAFEKQIEAAVVRGDVAFLERVCADDFRFTHGDGWTSGGPPLRVENKAQWLASVARRPYLARDVDSQQIELHGDIAITYGRYRARNRTGDPARREFTVWYERVYARRNAQWQYLSHRTVRGPSYAGASTEPAPGPSSATPSPYPVISGAAYKFEKIADGVYYATSTGAMVTGSNNPVIVGDRDVMVVDTGTSPAAARAMIDDLRKITDKPVRYVVDTHFHYDHTDGNQVYAGKADVFAHEYVKYAIENLDVLHREPFKTSQLTNVPARIETLTKQIAAETDVQRKATLQRQLAAAEHGWEELKEIRPTPPNKTYAKRLDLRVGEHDVQLLFLGRGHTGGDTVVYLPKERIVCTGDLMETGLAYMGDAYFDEWVTTLEALKKLDFTIVLPGHGTPFGEKAHITAYQSYLTDLTKQIADLRQRGVPAEEAAQRVDLTSHKGDFPQIQRPGADVRGVRRMYEWMDERGKR
jgi:cyclase